MRWLYSFVLLLTSCVAFAGESEKMVLETYEGDSVSFRTLPDTGRLLPSLPEPAVVVLNVYEITLAKNADEIWDRLSEDEQARFLKAPQFADKAEAKRAAVTFWKSAFASRLIMITSVEHSKVRATVTAKLYEFNDNSGRRMAIKLVREDERWVLSEEPEHLVGNRRIKLGLPTSERDRGAR